MLLVSIIFSVIVFANAKMSTSERDIESMGLPAPEFGGVKFVIPAEPEVEVRTGALGIIACTKPVQMAPGEDAQLVVNVTGASNILVATYNTAVLDGEANHSLLRVDFAEDGEYFISAFLLVVAHCAEGA